jgi:tetratricopeptide (TPR) repeat protein
MSEGMRMRIGLTICCLLLLRGVANSSVGEPPQPSLNAQSAGLLLQAVLREASDVALKQAEQERYWTQRVLLDIADVQIRAGDFDGALRSILGSSYIYGREAGLVHLAEALARDGNRERAFDVLRIRGDTGGAQQAYLQDAVQLQWARHLIASGDLEPAGKAIEQMKSNRFRPDGLRELAVAFAESGDRTGASVHFRKAIETALLLKDDYERASAIWQTAKAQLMIGEPASAKETIRRLVETVELTDPWAKVAALRESAVLAAKAKDEQTAHRLFQRAIEVHDTLDELNRLPALEQIGVAQAGVGFIDDALKTASEIRHDEKDFTRDGNRERVLYGIAVAQVEAGDPQTAIATALAITHFVQYRDDALDKVVQHQIAKQDLKAALGTTEKFENPSRKATAILKVAIAYARSGNRKTATDLAARIQLTHRDARFPTPGPQSFDYRRPESWGGVF